jgi:hypothetical protein
MPVDHVSLTVTPVWLRKGGEYLSIATGFFLGHEVAPNQRFLALITNRHVVTGRPSRDEGQSLGDSIEFEIREAGQDPGRVRRAIYPLYTTTNEPTWLVSSSNPQADVAVIPLPLGSIRFEVPPYCLGLNWVDYDILPYPGEAVSVVGYPLAWRDRVNRLPVWKTGHIASEPEQDFDGQPRFLIDVTGRPGMSGSPVIAGHRDLYFTRSQMPKMGGSGALLGVYASNARRFDDTTPASEADAREDIAGLSSDLDRPELGFVWKSSILGEIVKNLRPDSFSERVLRNLPKIP